jgi:Protein of unknown function (DUF1549)/Protein of unknown function (DUF1553)
MSDRLPLINQSHLCRTVARLQKMPAFRTMMLTLLTILLMSRAASGLADLPAPDQPIHEVIDSLIDQKLTSEGRSASAPAEATVLLRRMTLDIAGRIPTPVEYAWFVQQPEERRQELLADRLLSLPDADFHLASSLHELLLADQLYDTEFRDYLLWAVRQRRPWDQMFRDMLTVREAEGPERGASQFLKTRARELDDLTNDTAVLFFGVNVSCAKCHDHPLVDDWKQDHFYGMQSFFSRTFVTRRNVLTERPFGEVRFKTTSGEERQASLMFLNGTVVEDKTPPFPDDERKRLEEQMRKLEQDEHPGYIVYPDFSPRRALVDAALQDQTDLFLARCIVNRIWARLMGVGLVDPPDQMHSGNPATHPELLAWLARDLAGHHYDLRRLIRGIVLSRTYARTSVPGEPSAVATGGLYAIGNVRALTPRQLAASLLMATRHPERWPACDAMAEWAARRQEIENNADGLSREFELPGAGFQVAVDEALYFSNNERVQQELLALGDDRLLGKLQTLTADSEAVEQLWVSVLTRLPDQEERQSASAWLQRPGQDRSESLRSLLWALLASPEMRFNH